MYNTREMVKIYNYVEKTCNLYKSYFWRKQWQKCTQYKAKWRKQIKENNSDHLWMIQLWIALFSNLKYFQYFKIFLKWIKIAIIIKESWKSYVDQYISLTNPSKAGAVLIPSSE